MGDVAMTVPVIRALTEQHPNCKVTILSKPFLKPLFKDIPNVSFFAAEVKGKHKSIQGLYQLFKDLKELKITHVADFHNVLRSKILRRFFSFTKVSIAKIDKGRAEKRALTRESNKVFKQLKTSHERYADVLKSLGFEINITQPKPLDKETLSKKTIELTGDKKIHGLALLLLLLLKGRFILLN